MAERPLCAEGNGCRDHRWIAAVGLHPGRNAARRAVLQGRRGSAGASSVSAPPPASSDVTTTGGTVKALPLFTTATNLQSSAITQAGSGATANDDAGVLPVDKGRYHS
jgi:hypothetical protein